jgi:hypothetical protein
LTELEALLTFKRTFPTEVRRYDHPAEDWQVVLLNAVRALVEGALSE